MAFGDGATLGRVGLGALGLSGPRRGPPRLFPRLAGELGLCLAAGEDLPGEERLAEGLRAPHFGDASVPPLAGEGL